MKKQMNEKVEEAKVQKKEVKKSRKFFLYSEGKGFIRLDESDPIGMPNFEKGEAIFFESRAKAIFARDFFLKVKLADSIDILTKVA